MGLIANAWPVLAVLGTLCGSYMVGNWIYKTWIFPWLDDYFKGQDALMKKLERMKLKPQNKKIEERARTEEKSADTLESIAGLAERQRSNNGKASAAAEVLEKNISVKRNTDGSVYEARVNTSELYKFLQNPENVKNMTREERSQFEKAVSEGKKLNKAQQVVNQNRFSTTTVSRLFDKRHLVTDNDYMAAQFKQVYEPYPWDIGYLDSTYSTMVPWQFNKEDPDGEAWREYLEEARDEKSILKLTNIRNALQSEVTNIEKAPQAADGIYFPKANYPGLTMEKETAFLPATNDIMGRGAKGKKLYINFLRDFIHNLNGEIKYLTEEIENTESERILKSAPSFSPITQRNVNPSKSSGSTASATNSSTNSTGKTASSAGSKTTSVPSLILPSSVNAFNKGGTKQPVPKLGPLLKNVGKSSSITSSEITQSVQRMEQTPAFPYFDNSLLISISKMLENLTWDVNKISNNPVNIKNTTVIPSHNTLPSIPNTKE
jgi:hypothetical protein